MNGAAAALDSLRSSDRLASAAGANHAPRFADRGRFRGHRGGVITMHRALARFVFEPLIWSRLPCSCCCFHSRGSLAAVALPDVGLPAGKRHENPGAALDTRSHGTSRHAVTFVSGFRIRGWKGSLPMPGRGGPRRRLFVWCMRRVTFFRRSLRPITYLLRAVLFIQFTALLYFLLAAARFPHTPDSYMEGLVSYQIALISAVPTLFGLTYYIFKFGLIKKIALTVLTMSHLSLFLPVQILLQAMVLEKSVLFMPILYIVFGLPVDILLILAFYSWGMSWPSDRKVKSG